MEFRATREGLLEALDRTSAELAWLGAPEALRSYLNEEIAEAERQGLFRGGDWIIKSPDPQSPNPHNVLALHLAGAAKPPRALSHHWAGGDYPDIDADFDPARRDEIFEYLRGKYGPDKVMKAATWGTSNVKGALLDLSKVVTSKDGRGAVQRPSFHEVQDVTRQIDMAKASKGIDLEDRGDEAEDDDEEAGEEAATGTIAWAERNVEGARALFRKFPDLKRWAEPYRAIIRSSGQHAAAVVISSDPISEYLPVMRSRDGDPIIALCESGSSDKKELQPQGAIKYDFLGLANMRVIDEAQRLIRARRGFVLDEEAWHKIGFGHEKAYALARADELDGIFQFEKSAGRKTTREVGPRSFADLAFINAGMRPGAAAANAARTYHEHMEGRRDPSYPDHKALTAYGVSDDLIRFLDETHGVIAYQEQIMLFLFHVAGFTLAETNKVRKAIATTNPEAKRKQEPYLAKVREQYDRGCAAKGLPPDLAARWWDVTVSQASYSFNKSHCVAYALIAYRQLWLKAYFPTEFFCALINNTKKDKLVSQYVMAASRLGVRVKGPCVNASSREASVAEDNLVVMGLSRIKNVGDRPVDEVVGMRPEGGYRSFEHFLQVHGRGGKRTSSVNRKIMESMIKAGCFDSVSAGTTRADLLDSYLVACGEQPVRMDWREVIDAEREHVGHLFTETRFTSERTRKMGFAPLSEVNQRRGRQYYFAVVDDVTEKETKGGKAYHIVVLSDLQSEARFFAWPGCGIAEKGVKEGDVVAVTAFRNEKGYLNISSVDQHKPGMGREMKDVFER